MKHIKTLNTKSLQNTVKKGGYNLQYVDGRIIDKYPEEYLKMAQGVVEYNVSNLEYVDVRIIDKYPKEYLKMTQDVVEYNKYNFSSAVVNALYILKLSSYNLSIVPFASSSPSCFNISLSVSFKKPSSLRTLGNSPSFNPIINIAFTL